MNCGTNRLRHYNYANRTENKKKNKYTLLKNDNYTWLLSNNKISINENTMINEKRMR